MHLPHRLGQLLKAQPAVLLGSCGRLVAGDYRLTDAQRGELFRGFDAGVYQLIQAR